MADLVPAPPEPPYQRRLGYVALGLGLLFALFYGVVALNRYLVNDDYQLLYTAWLRSTGAVPNKDFALYSYHLIPDLLALLFRPASESLLPLWAGRFTLVLCLVGVAWLLHRVTGELFGRTAGLLAPILVLANETISHRALDLRPDLITTLGWLGVLALLLKPAPLSRKNLLALGLIVGLLFVNRFKALVIGLLMAPIIWSVIVRETPSWPTRVKALLRAAALLASMALIPLGCYAAYLSWLGELSTYLQINFGLLGVIASASSADAGRLLKTIELTWQTDMAFWIMAGVGVVVFSAETLIGRGRRSVERAALLALLLLSVAINPAFYYYNFVTQIPLAAPFAALPLARLVDRIGQDPQRANVALGCGVLALLLPIFLERQALISHALFSSNEHQLALQRFISQYTPPDQPIFAMEGIGLYRRSNFHWRLPKVMLPPYRAGAIDLQADWRRRPPALIISSYRVPRWLIPADRRFLAEHYVELAPYLLVPGFRLGARGVPLSSSRAILVSAEYELLEQPAGACAIDGISFSSRNRRPLAAGDHALRVAPGGRCVVRQYFPAAARELVKNRQRIPYLLAPQDLLAMSKE
jgi:hypothetical protein